MQRLFFLLAAVTMMSCSDDADPNGESTPEFRSFYMGFTAFPYDFSVDAQLETYKNVAREGDLFLNHLDHGVPWDEALNDLPFPTEVQTSIDATKSGLNPGTKILLTTTPTNQTRDDIAEYWNDNGSHQPLPNLWQGKTFDDPDVISAFTKYCRRIIDAVQPDYFAYGIEVTAAFTKDDENYTQFLTLIQNVYPALKSEYPDLPIFLTFQDRSFNNTHQELLAITKTMLPYSDFIAISSYPFLDYGNLTRDANPDLFADLWLKEFRDLDSSKPFAISETGFCADDLVIENLGVNVKGKAEWQEAYMTKLFEQANTLDAEFLAWFVYRDYDLLYEATANPPDILKVWRDNGLLDGEGNQRPSHLVWLDWMSRQKN